MTTPIQQIVLAILKGEFSMVFAGCFSLREKKFSDDAQELKDFKHLKVNVEIFQKEAFLTWDSAIKSKLYCPITDTGFVFSQVSTNVSTFKVDMLSNHPSHWPESSEFGKILKSEVKAIKGLFRSFSADVRFE